MIRRPPRSTHWEVLLHPFTPANPHSPKAEFNCMETYGDLLFAGSYGHGVFISYNNGETWNDINGDLNDYQVTVLNISNNKLYVGVDGGVWARSLNTITSTTFFEQNDGLILNIFPVPAEDFINITIKDHDMANEIHLSLYDAKGTLIKSQFENSHNNIQMDVRKIPSGIYFLQATSGIHQGMI